MMHDLHRPARWISAHALPALVLLTGLSAAGVASAQDAEAPRWLAGDHHVHSRFSATYAPNPADPAAVPAPTLGGGEPHTIVQNGAAAGRFGLSWTVSTDHGGPRHSVTNAEQAYPELLQSRATTPGRDPVLWHGAGHPRQRTLQPDHPDPRR
jgi:hypothetical protein